jgi:hypothetical protein
MELPVLWVLKVLKESLVWMELLAQWVLKVHKEWLD